MIASTLLLIYVDQLKANPERRNKVKSQTSFDFSDVRRIITEAGLGPDFSMSPPNKSTNSPVNLLVAIRFRMVA